MTPAAVARVLQGILDWLDGKNRCYDWRSAADETVIAADHLEKWTVPVPVSPGSIRKQYLPGKDQANHALEHLRRLAKALEKRNKEAARSAVVDALEALDMY